MKDKLCKQIPWTTCASAWDKPCSVSPVLLRVAVMVLFDLLLLFRGEWASVSPATCGEGSWLCCQRSFESVKLQGQKWNLVFFVMEEPLPQRDRTDGQCWAWLKCCWSLQLGERLERGMLSLEVPLWSLLAFVGSQQLKGEKAFLALGIWAQAWLPPQLASAASEDPGPYRSWQTRMNWWLTSTIMSEMLVLFCCSCMFFNLYLFYVVFSLKRGSCVHVQQRMKMQSGCFWKKSLFGAVGCCRWMVWLSPIEGGLAEPGFSPGGWWSKKRVSVKVWCLVFSLVFSPEAAQDRTVLTTYIWVQESSVCACLHRLGQVNCKWQVNSWTERGKNPWNSSEAVSVLGRGGKRSS